MVSPKILALLFVPGRSHTRVTAVGLPDVGRAVREAGTGEGSEKYI